MLFLLEILSEEIPAKLQKSGAEHLFELFKKNIENKGIALIDNRIFYSSQRIAISCKLNIQKTAIINVIRGPKKDVSEEILQNFLKKYTNKSYKQIIIDDKYHAIEIKNTLNENHESIKKNLSQICIEALQNFDWHDKTMIWKSDLPKWIRPLRSICCLLDDEVIDFEFCWVKSSNQTHGHKILDKWAKFDVTIDQYEELLEKHFVVVCPNKRLDIIMSDLRTIDFNEEKIDAFSAKRDFLLHSFPPSANFYSITDNLIHSLRGALRNENLDNHKAKLLVYELRNNSFVQLDRLNHKDYDGPIDEMKHLIDSLIYSNASINIDLEDLNIQSLIDELICLAEYPQVIECEIEEKFLSLPTDLINHIMISHQRYIPNPNGKNYYVVIDHNNPNPIMSHGYQKVLNARLSDGKFYWEKFKNSDYNTLIDNLKKTKSEYIPELSVYDFNEICANGDQKLHNLYNKLSCDLGSELIIEYPALRGLMAKTYNGEIANNSIYYGESELYKKETNFFEQINELYFAATKNLLKAHYYLIAKKEKPTSSRDPLQIRKAIEISIEIESTLSGFLSMPFGREFAIIKQNYNLNNIKDVYFDVLLNYDIRISNQDRKISHNFFIKKHKDNFDMNYVDERIKFLRSRMIFIDKLFQLSIGEENEKAYKRIGHHCTKKYKNILDKNIIIKINLASKQEERNFIALIHKFEKLDEQDIFDALKDLQIAQIINNFLDNIRIEVDYEAIKNNRINIICRFFQLIENLAPIYEIIMQ